MPPSGFKIHAQFSLEACARHCSQDLMNEVSIKLHPSFTAGVAKEREDIRQVLANPSTPSGLERGLCEFMGGYYDLLAIELANGNDPDTAIELAVKKLGRIIAKVHIEEGKLVERPAASDHDEITDADRRKNLNFVLFAFGPPALLFVLFIAAGIYKAVTGHPIF